MSPRRTRRGTARENISDTCIESSLKSSPVLLRSTSRTNKRKTVKRLEEGSNDLEISNSLINDVVLKTKKRRRNIQEVLENEDSEVNLTIEESKTKSRTKNKISKTPMSTKKPKSNNTPVLISAQDSSNTMPSNVKRQVSYSINNLANEDNEIPGKVSRKKKKSESSQNKKERKTPEKETTPKSSPINVSLTPHRSRKTPKRSPINLGSPKTRAHDSVKLPNVQRKLSIINSPSSSEESNKSFKEQLNDSNTGNNSLDNTNQNNKILSVSKSSSTKRKSFSPSFNIKPRFSKSPKIVLRTPKSKSAKSMKTSSSTKATKKLVSASSSKSKRASKMNESLGSVKSPEPEKLFTSTSSQSKITPSSSSKSKKSVKSTKARKSPIISPLNSRKMPKIILSTKKSSKSKKSTKSVWPVKELSESKSPLKTSIKSPMNDSGVKQVEEEINLSANNKCIDNKLLKDSSMSPKVVVNKCTSVDLRNSIIAARENQPTVNLISVDHVLKNSMNSGSSTNTSFNCKDLMPCDRKVSSPVVNFKQDVSNPISENKMLNVKPRNTSSPRDKVKQTLNLESEKKAFRQLRKTITLNGSSTPKPKAVKRLKKETSDKKEKFSIEDESEPSLNDSSLINMSDVFVSDNSQKDITFEITKSNYLDKRKSLQETNVSLNSIKNNTYEIDKSSNSCNASKVTAGKDDTYELETPRLQSAIKSRKTNDQELLGASEKKPVVKKSNNKVHFANSDLRTQANTINRVGTPGHAMQQNKTLRSIILNLSNQSLANNIESRKKKLQVKKTPVNNNAKVKRLSISLSDSLSKSRRSNHKAQIDSINRLSKPKPLMSSEKKLGTKTPVVKKIPNFADIHQKNFDKMESLIDAKKRIEKRHLHLNSATPNPKKTPTVKYQNGSNKPLVPSDSTNGIYNKFGFKLRKKDAMSIVSTKQAGIAESREKKRENARNILKGVRMNRRFELQMQSRIKNSQ